MFLVILTLSIYLTSAFEESNINEDIAIQNFHVDTPYNIYDYIRELHLERCALVGIGLKNYAVSYTTLNFAKVLPRFCRYS